MSQTATAPAKTPFAYTGEVTISVNVKDMNRAIDWYGEAFGFELIYKLDDWGWCELSTPLAGVHVGLGQTADPIEHATARLVRLIERELQALERSSGRVDLARIERDATDFFPVIVSVGTTSGDRRMKESDVEQIMTRLASRPTTVHVVLYTGGPQGANQAAVTQGSPFAGANQSRVGTAVAKYSGGTYENINNASRFESLLPAIGEDVAAAVERYRQQFRITAVRPANAAGSVGKVNVRVASPLVTTGLSFDGPVR